MPSPHFLVLTGHHYASARRAKVHFVVDSLSARGPTAMFTVGSSRLLRLGHAGGTGDRDLVYNRPVAIGDVVCFAWRPLVHPFNPRHRALHPVSRWGFEAYRRAVPALLRDWASGATTIVVESGLPVLFIADLRRWNPGATIIYLASDDLATLGCDPALSAALDSAASGISYACLSARGLAPLIPRGVTKYYVPQGMDHSLLAAKGPSPYPGGINAVSIGSMLFDTSFFTIAAGLFPEVTFHVIGSRARSGALPARVVCYPELAHAALGPYLAHADFGVAPYRDTGMATYLSDSSLKLVQYGAFGLPAVCPDFAVGDRPHRIGYRIGDAASIRSAITRAMARRDRTPVPAPSWREVTDRILAPWDAGPPTETATPPLRTGRPS